MYYSIMDVYELEEPLEYEEVEYKGYHVLACKTKYGYVLERLFSTNPYDFLSSDLQPGNLMQNNLIKQINQ